MEVNDGESQLPIYVDELQHQNDLSINVYEIQHQNIDKGYDTINDVLVALKYKEPEGISWFDNIENLSVQIPSRIKLDIMKKTKSSNQLIEIDCMCLKKTTYKPRKCSSLNFMISLVKSILTLSRGCCGRFRSRDLLSI